MGNTPPSPTFTFNQLTSRGSVGTRPRLSTFSKPTSIYNEILKDAEKLRQSDKKSNYNPHRRIQSIASNLPTQLQNYSNSIHIVNEFWLNYVQSLPDTELNEIVTVCYCRLYLKCKNVRQILNASHGMKVFNVFGYVIRNLVDPSNHLKLFKQLQLLGKMHSGYNLDNGTYELFVDSFNYAMEEKFKSDYKIRTRFCFGQLYRVIVDIMTGDDFYSVTTRLIQNSCNNKALSPILRLKRFSSAHSRETRDKKEVQAIQPIHGVDTSSGSNINDEEFDDEELNRLQSPKKKKKSFNFTQIDSFLGSLEECLSDEKGSLYFQKYLEEQFCVENFLFHEFVLKYKASKSAQRIKLGQLIVDEFVQIGSEKEVNLSYNTRRQILTIINLVKKMNQNKEKYQQIVNNTNMSKILNEDDIKSINNEKSDGHYRMATTKKLPIELFEITNLQNEDIPDLIYSMGFTANLFDKAYDEIFNLMRINFWSNFRNAILEFVDDDEFVKLQKEKYLKRREEQRNMGGMIQVINSIQRSINDSHNNKDINNNNGNQDIITLRNMLSTVDSVRSPSQCHDKQTHYNYNAYKNNIKKDRNDIVHGHKRRKSKDDFDVNYKSNNSVSNLSNLSHISTRTRLTLNSSLIGSKLTLLLDDNGDEKENSDTVSESESESDNKIDNDSDSDDILDENTAKTMKRKVINRRITPRLSFIPSLMPSIEKSVTSPTVKQQNSAIDTPNGGAAIVSPFIGNYNNNNDDNPMIKLQNIYQNNDGSYSPSELFNLVSSTIPWDYSNNINQNNNTNDKKRKSAINNNNNNDNKTKRKSIKDYNKPLPYNKQLPLYVTHKKRKSQLAKRNSLRNAQPINALTQS